jgi:hypothetical protein
MYAPEVRIRGKFLRLAVLTSIGIWETEVKAQTKPRTPTYPSFLL